MKIVKNNVAAIIQEIVNNNTIIIIIINYVFLSKKSFKTEKGRIRIRTKDKNTTYLSFF